MLPNGKAHQTALVLDLRGTYTNHFTERARRLLDCLNGNAIKVDVYSLIGNAQNTGPALIRGTDPSREINKHFLDNEEPIDLNAWSVEQGYGMLIVSCPAGDPQKISKGVIAPLVAEGKADLIDGFVKVDDEQSGKTITIWDESQPIDPQAFTDWLSESFSPPNDPYVEYDLSYKDDILPF